MNQLILSWLRGRSDFKKGRRVGEYTDVSPNNLNYTDMKSILVLNKYLKWSIILQKYNITVKGLI